MFCFLRYVLSHPLEAWRTFWRVFAGTEDPNERIVEEESRLNTLRLAIGFYEHKRRGRRLVDLFPCRFNFGGSQWKRDVDWI